MLCDQCEKGNNHSPRRETPKKVFSSITETLPLVQLWVDWKSYNNKYKQISECVFLSVLQCIRVWTCRTKWFQIRGPLYIYIFTCMRICVLGTLGPKHRKLTPWSLSELWFWKIYTSTHVLQCTVVEVCRVLHGCRFINAINSCLLIHIPTIPCSGVCCHVLNGEAMVVKHWIHKYISI